MPLTPYTNPGCGHGKCNDRPFCLWSIQGPITKWDVMSDRDRLGAINTPLNIPCSGCGKNLATEAEFARHFVIKDRQYLNLGDCPGSKRRPIGLTD